MPSEIMVVRYSNSGFTPLFQKKMWDSYAYHLSFAPEQLEIDLPSDTTLYTKSLILEQTLKIKAKLDHSFSFFGIHVFIGEPSERYRAFQLNHLPKNAKKPAKHTIYLNPLTPVRLLADGCTIPEQVYSLHTAQQNGFEAIFIEGCRLAAYNQELAALLF